MAIDILDYILQYRMWYFEFFWRNSALVGQSLLIHEVF